MTVDRPTLGLVLGGSEPPDQMITLARLADESGFEELWVTEDCWFSGGFGAIGAVLAATRHVRVGTGIVSAFTRHPSIVALEFATLSRLFPGRITAGIGLGLPSWLDQMGVRPSPMRRSLEQVAMDVRALLAGEVVGDPGPPFKLDGVSLAYPPREHIPIVFGVAGPRLLELSGACADGTLLGFNSSPAYVRWARARIATGAQENRHQSDHRVTVMALFSIHEDKLVARAAVRARTAEYLANGGPFTATDVYGISGQLKELIDAGGRDAVERDMPDVWIDDLAIAGDVIDCKLALRRLAEAGADSVVLYPQPALEAEEVIRRAARTLL